MAFNLPEQGQALNAPSPEKDVEVIIILEGYRQEADTARRSGDNPRDIKWQENLDAYWLRMDMSEKADWQSKIVMPETAEYVDRFAAAMTDALGEGDEFYSINVPGDRERDISRALQRLMAVWMSKCATAPNGIPLSFRAVFEDVMKAGAYMSSISDTTWDYETERVKCEAVDPRFVWYDPSGRGMYRVRRRTVDKSDLMVLARKRDLKGRPLYDLQQIMGLASDMSAMDLMEQQRAAGHGRQVTSNRKEITLDEYVAKLVDSQGRTLYDGEYRLCVVANQKWLIRGPEPIPFWHGEDWLVGTPLITVPFSVYGKSYIENLAPIMRAFTDMTNLLLDASWTSAMKVFAADPSKLENPNQLASGIAPNKIFKLNDDIDPSKFMASVDLGKLGAEPVAIWQMLKSEAQEGAYFNELSLGQLAPNGRTSAREVTDAQYNSFAVMRSLARTVETRLLEPWLHRILMTGIQHLDPNDEDLIDAVGSPELMKALYSRRKEFLGRKNMFRVRGITGMVERASKLRAFLQILGVVAKVPQLLQAFAAKYPPDRIIDFLFRMSDVDPTDLEATPREEAVSGILQQQALAQQAAQQQQPGAAQPQPGAPAGPVALPTTQMPTGGPGTDSLSAALAQMASAGGGDTGAGGAQ